MYVYRVHSRNSSSSRRKREEKKKNQFELSKYHLLAAHFDHRRSFESSHLSSYHPRRSTIRAQDYHPRPHSCLISYSFPNYHNNTRLLSIRDRQRPNYFREKSRTRKRSWISTARGPGRGTTNPGFRAIKGIILNLCAEIYGPPPGCPRASRLKDGY